MKTQIYSVETLYWEREKHLGSSQSNNLLFSTKDVCLQWRSKRERGRECIFHRSKGFSVFSQILHHLFIVVEVDMCCFLIGKSVTFLLFSTKDVSLQWRSKKERGRESIFHRSKGFNVFSQVLHHPFIVVEVDMCCFLIG